MKSDYLHQNVTIWKQQRSIEKSGVAKQKTTDDKNNEKEGQSYEAGAF